MRVMLYQYAIKQLNNYIYTNQIIGKRTDLSSEGAAAEHAKLCSSQRHGLVNAMP